MFRRIAMAALMAAPTVGCGVAEVRGSGVSRAELRAADGFDEVSAGDGIEVTVAVGERASVTVESDENVLPFVDTHVEQSVLIIEARDGFLLAPTRAIHVTIVSPRPLVLRGQASTEAALSSTGTREAELADAPLAELIKTSMAGNAGGELPETGGIDPGMLEGSMQAK